MRLFIQFLLLSNSFFVSHLANAHDPGLSYVEIKFQQDHLGVNLAFARRDIESLVAIDTDQNGIVNVQEFTAAKPQLEKLANSMLTIHKKEDLENQLLFGKLQSVTINESDALQLSLLYPLTKAEKLVISAPLIAELPRGHRQYLQIKDQNDQLLDNAMLSATSLEKAIEVPKFTKAVMVSDQGFSDQSSRLLQLSEFIKQGIHHIWIGLDHILFIVTLLLPVVLIFNRDKRNKFGWMPVESIRAALISTLQIVTVFTFAHSITLSLATLEIIQLPSRLVEPVIALSVILVACNNLWPLFLHSRGLLVFVFGLIHGFGFASVLTELPLPEGNLLISLLGFNLGVEIGQVVIVVLLLPALYSIRRAACYQPIVLQGGSVAAAVIAGFWLYERVVPV